MKKALFSIPITLLLITSLSLSGFAQNSWLTLKGQVQDQSGAVVSGSLVRLRQPATGFERITKTDETGSFAFDQLIEGDYDLSVNLQGFSALTRPVHLVSGQPDNLKIELQPAAIAEEIAIKSGRLAETPEIVERTPGSIELLDQKLLEESRVFTFSEALRKVSGITVRDEEGFGLRPNIGIRGLNPTRSSKVLLLEDGIPLTYAPYGDNASYYHPPIDRFESIEILKGSGQIAYGPVTVGGVINYVTPNPPTKPSGQITLIGGNRDYFNGHFGYGGTWKGIGLLFDYTRKQGDGARENTHSDLNDFNFKSLIGIGSRQALTLKANYYGEDSNVTYSGLRLSEYLASPRQNPFKNDFFYGDRFGASATHSLIFNNALALTTNLYTSVFHRDWWRQSSNSGQRPNDAADPKCGGMQNLNTTCGNEGRLRDYYVWGLEPKFRANFRLFGINNDADFGFRLHVERQERQQQNGDTPTARSGVLVENNQRKNQAYSGFIQNRFFLGNVTITPGVRVEHINYQRLNRLANSGAGISGRTDLTQLVPGIGVSYNPKSSVTLFAGVHRGFAPPRTEDIINNTTGGSIDLDPELSWNYEVGVRGLLHQGVRLEATFFRMDYENQIIPASLAGGVGAALTNAGETLHQGFEFSTRLDTGTILKSRHNIFLSSAYTFLPTAKFTGRRFSNVSGFTNVLITDNRLPYAPEHLLNFTVGYSSPVGLNTFIEAVRVNRQFGDDLNTINPTADGQRGLLPGYTVLNATANYNVESWRTTFFVTAKNLADKLYIVDRSRGILPSSPRLIQAGLKFRF
ncbi:MAG: TonB-dependent receptor [Acidobacteriota bacterium]